MTYGNLPGSKRGRREAHGDYHNDKDCWVYPLTAHGRIALAMTVVNAAEEAAP